MGGFNESIEKNLWIAKRYGLPSKWVSDLVKNLRKTDKTTVPSFDSAPLIRDDDIVNDEYVSILDKNIGVTEDAITKVEEKDMNLQQQVNKVISFLCDDLESFTSIDVSNRVKQNGLFVRHREVAHLVRTAYANKDLVQYGYVRDLINVTLKNGESAQAFLYHHATVPTSEYKLRDQVALSPDTVQQQTKNKDQVSPPAPTVPPVQKQHAPTQQQVSVNSQTNLTKTTVARKSERIGVQKADGRLEIPSSWIAELGWTEGMNVYATSTLSNSILLTRTPGQGADILRKFVIDRWGRIRLSLSVLNKAGKNRGYGGCHTLTLQDDSIKVD